MDDWEKIMRDSIEILKTIKNEHKEVFDFIVEKAHERNASGNLVYFVGLREDRICIYYQTRLMLQFELQGNNKLIITTQNAYIKDTNLKRNLKFEELTEENIGKIKSQIDKFILDNSKREFACQHYLATMYNSHPESGWFVVDMEYEQKGSRSSGRQDLIAIRRKAMNGKYEIALVELKVGARSYGGISKDMAEKKYASQYKEIKNSLYLSMDETTSNNASETKNVKFGSGIVSHMVGFMRYLYKEENYEVLKNELIGMLNAYRLLGINDVNIKSPEDFFDKPTVYIVSYTHVPGLDSEIEIEKKKALLAKTSMQTAQQRLKFIFGRYLFYTPYCLINMLNEKEISVFTDERERAQTEYADFVDSSDMTKQYKQSINGKDYTFFFSFVDPDKKDNPWECLV